MSFSETWLALRAVYDSAARSRVLEDRLSDWARDRAATTGTLLSVVDLGAGSGNNFRHLAPRLKTEQSWTLVDSDPTLLKAAGHAGPPVATRKLDLAGRLEDAVPAGTDLVTASALIDLVSAEWLERLLNRVDAVGAALLVVLTYDGRTLWTPSDPLDDRVLALVNRHQHTDKGFGPALGPDAGPTLARLAGPRVLQDPSDWAIAANDSAMRAALVEGWATAATEMAPDEEREIAAWQDRSNGRAAGLVVGHADQLVMPAR